jgi:prepilin peptidase CpaA
MSAAILFTLGGCIAASYCDVRSRRIPNALTGSLALAAVIVHSLEGLHSLIVSVSVMAVMTLVGAFVYARGGIGGGDVKLAIAASGMLGYPLCIPFLLYTAIGGGVLAIFFLLFRGEARAMVSRVALITAGAARGIPTPRTTLPYALAFAFGATVIALSQTVAPFLRMNLS